MSTQWPTSQLKTNTIPTNFVTNNFWLCLHVRQRFFDLHDLSPIQADYFKEYSVHQFQT
ncbi:MAG: hypothetical protein ACK5P5_12455 [Pseudobdellovibrionaceae bacterium]